MEAFLVSTGIVALAEIGDKTQLLALILAAKFRKPTPIVLGILVATLANHGFAGALGAWITSLVEPQTTRWILGISFIAMAAWTLIPDKFDEDDAKLRSTVFSSPPSSPSSSPRWATRPRLPRSPWRLNTNHCYGLLPEPRWA